MKYLFSLMIALVGLAPGPASAQEVASDYPTRPVRIIVPFAAGGGTDLITRLVADAVAADWKTTFVIENRPGGGTTIGSQAALAAPADGYTLLAASGSFIVSPMLMKKQPYAWDQDFEPVALFAESPHVLVVHPAVPARDVASFAKWAKTPGLSANYASFGRGSSNHLGFETLNARLGVKLAHVPYTGSAPAMRDLIGGHVQAMLGDLQNVASQIAAGKLVALGVAGERRLPLLPDTPTIAEQGGPDLKLAGFASRSWFGALMRAGAPEPIIRRWNEAIRLALRTDRVRGALEPLGLFIADGDRETFKRFLAQEAVSAREAIATAGIEAQ